MSSTSPKLGMVLKGYPRISESFISTEILLLESLGLNIELYSLRQPREDFMHRRVKRITAPVTYLPEYVLPHWQTFLKSNAALWKRLGAHYRMCLRNAVRRAWQIRKLATVRHFLQAGHLSAVRLLDSNIGHLHAHFCHTPTSVALFASQLSGLPFSFTAHAKDIYTSDPEQIRRKIRMARFVVTCTRYNARYLGELSAGNTPIHTIYHGIDLSFFSFGTAPAAYPPYRILSVGRPVPKKGYDDLLRALKILEETELEYEFTHIGSGELEDRMQRMVQELGLGSRVRMLGTLPHEEVIRQYRKAHCLALACKVAPDGDRDGIPNVLLEAMAVGLPVVSTRVSAIPELVDDGINGTLVEPANPGQMARALFHVLRNPERIQEQVPRARAKVESEFDNRRCVIDLYHLLLQALRDTQPPGSSSSHMCSAKA